jgi:hypothetical protein
VLNATEEESRGREVTKAHTRNFDKMKKSRRFIVQDVITDSDCSDEDDVPSMDEKDFLELYQNHLRRKRQRRKVRKAPDVSASSFG